MLLFLGELPEHPKYVTSPTPDTTPNTINHKRNPPLKVKHKGNQQILFAVTFSEIFTFLFTNNFANIILLYSL
jgi:hypothetical protein